MPGGGAGEPIGTGDPAEECPESVRGTPVSLDRAAMTAVSGMSTTCGLRTGGRAPRSPLIRTKRSVSSIRPASSRPPSDRAPPRPGRFAACADGGGRPLRTQPEEVSDDEATPTHQPAPPPRRFPRGSGAAQHGQRPGRPDLPVRSAPHRGQRQRDDLDAAERQLVGLRQAGELSGQRGDLRPAALRQQPDDRRRPAARRRLRRHRDRRHLRPGRQQPPRRSAAQRRPLARCADRPVEGDRPGPQRRAERQPDRADDRHHRDADDRPLDRHDVLRRPDEEADRGAVHRVGYLHVPHLRGRHRDRADQAEPADRPGDDRRQRDAPAERRPGEGDRLGLARTAS